MGSICQFLFKFVQFPLVPGNLLFIPPQYDRTGNGAIAFCLLDQFIPASNGFLHKA